MNGQLHDAKQALKRSPASLAIPMSGYPLWLPDQTRAVSEVGALRQLVGLYPRPYTTRACLLQILLMLSMLLGLLRMTVIASATISQALSRWSDASFRVRGTPKIQ